MKKQPNKNPKRVKASKKIAAQRLRIGGKFISKEFTENWIKKSAELSGVDVSTFAKLKRFLEQNENEFNAVWSTQGTRAGTERADTTVFKEMSEFQNRNGRLLLNGEDASLDEIKYRVLQIENYLFSNTNTAGVAYKPFVYWKGKMEMTLPSLEEIESLVEDFEGDDAALIEELKRYGITLWISSKKRKGVKAAENKRRNEKIERKAKRVSKMLQDAKTRTKRGGNKKRN